MKLKKLYNLSSKFIKFELIKLKILQKYSEKFNLKRKIDQLGVFFKKALRIISYYNEINKKILFIGIPQKVQNQYKHKLKKTKHSFLPDSYHTKNLFTNKFRIYRSLVLAKNQVLLKKEFDLIVVVNSKLLLPLIKKEALKWKIPMVFLTTEEISITEGSFYLIPGELTDFVKLKRNFFTLLLTPILKKKNRRVKHRKVKNV
jgi:hypothetical protein